MAADVLAPGFWEVGSYKHNTKRIKDGIDQLDEFCKMMKERVEIEAKYSKQLMLYSEKWKSHLDRVTTTGSVKSAWNGLIGEAATVSRIHSTMKDNLMDDIVKETVNYRKSSLHTSVFKGPKEIREIEDLFEKAQKPWKKLVDKMEDKKSKYYNACRQERSASMILQNSKTDTSVSLDGASKMRERHEKLKEEVQKSKGEYEKAINNLSQYKNVYMEAMSHVFKMCQEKELDRSQFVIAIIKKAHQYHAELARSNTLFGLHEQLETIFKAANLDAIKRDLANWSEVNGVDARSEWPQFMEYSPEMRHIATRGGSTRAVDGVVLTRKITTSDDVAPLPTTATGTLTGITTTTTITSVNVNTFANTEDSTKISPKSSSDSDTNTFDSRKHNITSKKYAQKDIQHPVHVQNGSHGGWKPGQGPESPPLSADTPDSAKYGDFEEYPISKSAVVLYDYSPAEADEVQLKKGATIEVLSEPDSLGWCSGRVNGVTGLFPASYVQISDDKS